MAETITICPTCGLDAPHHDTTAHRLAPELARLRRIEAAAQRAVDGEWHGADLCELREALATEPMARLIDEALGQGERICRLVESEQDALARAEKAEAERDEARAAFLRCADAIGVVYEADGCASAPGPIDVVERYIRDARLTSMEHIDCSARATAAEQALADMRITLTAHAAKQLADQGRAMALLDDRDEIIRHARAELTSLRAEVEALKDKARRFKHYTVRWSEPDQPDCFHTQLTKRRAWAQVRWLRTIGSPACTNIHVFRVYRRARPA